MNRKQFLYNDWRADDEEEDEKEEQPKSDIGMFSKKLEKYFFEKRAVYLWGVVMLEHVRLVEMREMKI